MLHLQHESSGGSGMLMISTVPHRKIKSTNFQEHLNSIDPHIKFTIELPGTNGLPFLDTLTKCTPNSSESTVYRKPTHTDRYLDYNSKHPIPAELSVIHTVIHRAKQVCSTLKFLVKEMDHLHSPTRQPLPSTIHSTRQTPTESQTHPQESS